MKNNIKYIESSYFNNWLIPIVIYNDLLKTENKSRIYFENRSKSGIYRWVNLINNKSYIGCSKNITKRLYFYYSRKNLKGKLSKGNCYICEALLKYGHENFRLEYCNKEDLLFKEEYYINKIKPEYNVLKKRYILNKYFHWINIIFINNHHLMVGLLPSK
jgi:excinuclease UvrABC nuclease subunit